ncbi:MAG: PIN domain nuclease [Actinomycetia bacterium]|nr:PIN domain nuclease [Actinomycetes bacterium]
MILVDSSAWVEFDRATGSATDEALTELIRADGPVAVTEPVVMEVCAGARSAACEHDLRRLLTRFHLARFDAAADFTAAVTIYRRCRRSGITPRGLIDCLIIAVALRHDCEVLAHDRDFARAAGVVDLRLHEASLT